MGLCHLRTGGVFKECGQAWGSQRRANLESTSYKGIGVLYSCHIALTLRHCGPFLRGDGEGAKQCLYCAVLVLGALGASTGDADYSGHLQNW